MEQRQEEIGKKLESDWKSLFAQRLEEVRIKLDLNKTELSQAMGTTSKSMTYYLSGSHEPKPSMIANLCLAKGVNAEWILLGTGEMLKAPVKPSAMDLALRATEGLTTREERAGPLYESLKKAYGMGHLLHYKPPGFDDYLSGTISEVEYMRRIKNELRAIKDEIDAF